MALSPRGRARPMVGWLAALLVVLAGAPSGRTQTPRAVALLAAVDSTAPIPARFADRLDTLQARVASADLDALDADRIELLLTGGRSVEAHLQRRERLRNGGRSWTGAVPGSSLSSVTLVEVGGVLQGSVRTLDSAWSIEPANGGLYVVREVSGVPPGADLEPLRPDAMADPAGGDPPPAAADDGTLIDVLVMYTAAARTAAGGTDAAVQARIALGVSESNAAYANSGVVPRLRLVGAALTPYTESADLSTDLARFRTAGDGYMDEVHAHRDALGADLMVLVTGAAAGGACGVGYVMTSLSATFAPWAFSVTAYPCISPNYTFAHELGHNMGSAHAPDDGAGQPSLYAYSFGYKNPANLFRTVMAYNCAAGCPRVLHFSNPDVSYSGATTGSPAQHNNALSINNAAATLANFRQAVGGGSAPTVTAIGNVTIAEDGSTAPIAFTVGDAETAASSLVVTAVSNNTALVPNTPSALALGGSGAGRTLVVTPAPNQFGTASVTVSVNDGSLTASRTFTLTVTAVNDAPTIARTPTAATIASGNAATTNVTISDIDTSGSALSLSTSSSNPTLLPAGGVGFTVVSTAASSRTLLVTMTPAAGQSGVATVTLTGSDGSATAVTTFVLTVVVPLPPTLSPLAPRTVAEDGALAVDFTVGDPDTPLSGLTVSATSGNVALVPPSGLGLAGSGAQRTLTVTPAANQSGQATIAISVGDGVSTTTGTFVLTVTPVDDAPAFAVGVPASVSTLVSTALSFPVTVTDIDTAGTTLALSGSSSNVALLAQAGIAIATVATAATSRTFTVTLTPETGATGTGTLLLSAGDGVSSVGRTVGVAVTSTPGPPDPPTTLTVSGAGSALAVSWTAASTGSTPTSYAVYVGTSPGATTLPVQTTAGTSLSVPLTASGTYYARVRARNAHGESTDSPESSVSIAVPNGKPGKLPKPRAWTSGRTLLMEWDPAPSAEPIIGHVLEVGAAPAVGDLLVLPLSASRSFTAPGVPVGTYWLRVRAVSAVGAGDASDDVGMVMTASGGCIGLTSSPGTLAAAVSNGVVSLSWTPPAGSVTPASYVLSAGTAPGLANLATFDTGSTAVAWSGVAPPGVYHVRVAGRTACGVGAPSNDVVVTVGGTAPPAAPTALSATVSGGVVAVAWTPPPGSAPAGYVLEVGSTAGASDIATIDVGTATAISGAAPPGRYFLRVRARGTGGAGPPSNEVDLTVP
ncbi:MAG: reprolysin-like metallopeptidase [Vicinamibacterales bacterium]